MKKIIFYFISLTLTNLFSQIQFEVPAQDILKEYGLFKWIVVVVVSLGALALLGYVGLKIFMTKKEYSFLDAIQKTFTEDKKQREKELEIREKKDSETFKVLSEILSCQMQHSVILKNLAENQIRPPLSQEDSDDFLNHIYEKHKWLKEKYLRFAYSKIKFPDREDVERKIENITNEEISRVKKMNLYYKNAGIIFENTFVFIKEDFKKELFEIMENSEIDLSLRIANALDLMDMYLLKIDKNIKKEKIWLKN